MSDVMDENKKKISKIQVKVPTYKCHNDSLCISVTVNELCDWITLINGQKIILILAFSQFELGR